MKEKRSSWVLTTWNGVLPSPPQSPKVAKGGGPGFSSPTTAPIAVALVTQRSSQHLRAPPAVATREEMSAYDQRNGSWDCRSNRGGMED